MTRSKAAEKATATADCGLASNVPESRPAGRDGPDRMHLTRMEDTPKAKIRKLQRLIDALCGIYTRVARRLRVHRTFVSRVARRQRNSKPVERALVDEYDRMKKQ